MTIEVSHQDGWMWKDGDGVQTVPSLTWGLVYVGDVETTDTHSITMRGRHDVSCLGDVTADVRCPAVLGVECIAYEVESLDAEMFTLSLLRSDGK